MEKQKHLKICTDCSIYHYENCNTCFGFGVYPGKEKPCAVTAVEAADKTYQANWYACPECKSTPLGIPEEKI